jgi:hypothetical protein
MAGERVSWATFAGDAPALAREGRRLFARGDTDHAFLVTVRGTELPPRIHPVTIGFVDGGLYAFLLRSPKRTDLEQDGRYALHALLDEAVPGEFSVRGRAHRVTDPAVRTAVAAGWPFEPDASFDLYEFSIETALLGERASADEWPPRYTSWAA